MKPTVLVIQHEDKCPPGWFADWLAAAGLDLDVLEAHRGRAIPAALTDHAGLLVLGGEMGANDDATTRWLAPTRALIATVAAGGDPFLGICLGHQLATVALGGTVARNPHGHGTGLTPYGPTSEAADDPLFAALTPGVPAVQWNNDIAIELPPQATVLARSPDGTVQAARFGTRAWGVQFHPEASPAIFRSWTTDKPSAREARADGIDVFAAADAVEAHAAGLRRAWEPLARRWGRIVRDAWNG
ncbi:type 1 glutamine amidotransferase [Ornithinimicrobium sp. F0845]|uniref:type 1 glutamine amidotransferase n=1 Tax=Ornithinimicrobium sp. F0845 TaxID=2926412 RepID=UPI001FF119E5|nr:type 1 glutamine amidotransferase [Ornithinimicrobium sp. F0845]MCK0111042.1 type 1 glutamine amidotransferase [Ornithinimicrobium sp. F0845]